MIEANYELNKCVKLFWEILLCVLHLTGYRILTHEYWEISLISLFVITSARARCGKIVIVLGSKRSTAQSIIVAVVTGSCGCQQPSVRSGVSALSLPLYYRLHHHQPSSALQL